MVFQEILFDVIKKDGMTVHELSKKSRVTERSIQYYLRGERSPNLNTADRILKAANINLTIGKK